MYMTLLLIFAVYKIKYMYSNKNVLRINVKKQQQKFYGMWKICKPEISTPVFFIQPHILYHKVSLHLALGGFHTLIASLLVLLP